MAGWAGSASSATFSGSVGGPLGLPINQLLLLLLDPVGVIVGFLHVHARLLAGFNLVAVVEAPDVLGTGDGLVFAILLELPRLDPWPSGFFSDARFLWDSVLVGVSATVLLLLFVELSSHGNHLCVTVLRLLQLPLEAKLV